MSANLWESVVDERAPNGTEVAYYGTDRFISAVQNEFAARMQWTLTSKYEDANHPPYVKIAQGPRCGGKAGRSVEFEAEVNDPDGDTVNVCWWQYLEEGTYNGTVQVTALDAQRASIDIPADATPGQRISIILQGTDDGDFPLSRYDRVMIEVS